MIELLRGRLCIAGPVTAEALAAPLGIDRRDAEAALLALESEGVILRGRFTSPREPAGGDAHGVVRSGAAGADPPLYAQPPARRDRAGQPRRLHALPVQVAAPRPDRSPERRRRAPRSAGAARRVRTRGNCLGAERFCRRESTGYEPSMLDMLCLAGEVGWARMSPRSSAASEPARLTPATPVALFLREHTEAWQSLRDAAGTVDGEPDRQRQPLAAMLQQRGASFFNDIAAAYWARPQRNAPRARRARRQRARRVGRLLRAAGTARERSRRARRPAIDGRASPGGGALIPAAAERLAECRDRSTGARACCARYGVVFRRLLTRESVRRRGGSWRGSTGGSRRGERFAAAVSCQACRASSSQCRARSSGCGKSGGRPADGRIFTISAADPLNLAGIVTSGERVRAAARNRLAYRDGVPIAVQEGDVFRPLAPLDAALAADAAIALRRRTPHGRRRRLSGRPCWRRGPDGADGCVADGGDGRPRCAAERRAALNAARSRSPRLRARISAMRCASGTSSFSCGRAA